MVYSDESFNENLGGDGWKTGELNISRILSDKGLHPCQDIVQCYLKDTKNPIRVTTEEFWINRDKYETTLGEGNNNPTVIASKNGTHWWLGENNPSVIALNNGTFRSGFGYGNKNNSHIASVNGTHWASGDKNHLYHKLPFNNINATNPSKLSWYHRDLVIEISNKNPSIIKGKGYKIANLLSKQIDAIRIYGYNPSQWSILKILEQSSVWTQLDESEWLEWKSSYNPPIILNQSLAA
jgi:hypothetical protein